MPYNFLINLVILVTVSEGLYVQNLSISRASITKSLPWATPKTSLF